MTVCVKWTDTSKCKTNEHVVAVKESWLQIFTIYVQANRLYYFKLYVVFWLTTLLTSKLFCWTYFLTARCLIFLHRQRECLYLPAPRCVRASHICIPQDPAGPLLFITSAFACSHWDTNQIWCPNTEVSELILRVK